MPKCRFAAPELKPKRRIISSILRRICSPRAWPNIKALSEFFSWHLNQNASLTYQDDVHLKPELAPLPTPEGTAAPRPRIIYLPRDVAPRMMPATIRAPLPAPPQARLHRRRKISEPPMLANGGNGERSLTPALSVTTTCRAEETTIIPPNSSFRTREKPSVDGESRFKAFPPPNVGRYGKLGSECSECSSCAGWESSEDGEEVVAIKRFQSQLEVTQSVINLLQKQVMSFRLSAKPASTGSKYSSAEPGPHRHGQIAYLRERVQMLEGERDCLAEELRLKASENDLNISLLREIAENALPRSIPLSPSLPASPDRSEPQELKKDGSEKPKKMERNDTDLSGQLSIVNALEKKHKEQIIAFQKQILELNRDLSAVKKVVEKAQENENRLRVEKLDGLERERVLRLANEELKGRVVDLENVLDKWHRAVSERDEMFMAMAAAEASRRHVLTQQFIHDYTLTFPHNSSSGQYILPLKASFLASVHKRRCLEGTLIFSLTVYAVMLILRTHWVSHGIVDLWAEWVLWVLVIISGTLGAFRVWLGVHHDGDLDALFSLCWTSFVCVGILVSLWASMHAIGESGYHPDVVVVDSDAARTIMGR